MTTKPRYQEHFDSWYADRAAKPAADAIIKPLRDEALWALQFFDLRRRVMATGTAP